MWKKLQPSWLAVCNHLTGEAQGVQVSVDSFLNCLNSLYLRYLVAVICVSLEFLAGKFLFSNFLCCCSNGQNSLGYSGSCMKVYCHW